MIVIYRRERVKDRGLFDQMEDIYASKEGE